MSQNGLSDLLNGGRSLRTLLPLTLWYLLGGKLETKIFGKVVVDVLLTFGVALIALILSGRLSDGLGVVVVDIGEGGGKKNTLWSVVVSSLLSDSSF